MDWLDQFMPKFFVPCRTTVLLTTYNRPQELKRLFTFWKAAGMARPVVVLDSSSLECMTINRKTCFEIGLPESVIHREFPTSVYPFEKWHRLMPEVTTPYVIFAAEDDFLIPSTLTQCEDFLDQHPDYAVCHGFYISFRTYGNSIRLVEDSLTTSNEADSPEERLVKQFNYYGHFTYGLRRTSTWNDLPKDIREVAGATPVEAGGVQEMVDAMLYLISGKVKRIPHLQIIRNGTPTPEDSWKKSFVFGPNFSETIGAFKGALIDALQLAGKRNREDYNFLLDECLKTYFGTVFRPSAKEHLPADFPVLRSSREEKKELKSIVESGDYKLPEFKSVIEAIRRTPLQFDLAGAGQAPPGLSSYEALNLLNGAVNSTRLDWGSDFLKRPRKQKAPSASVLRHPKKHLKAAIKRVGLFLGGNRPSA